MFFSEIQMMKDFCKKSRNQLISKFLKVISFKILNPDSIEVN